MKISKEEISFDYSKINLSNLETVIEYAIELKKQIGEITRIKYLGTNYTSGNCLPKIFSNFKEYDIILPRSDSERRKLAAVLFILARHTKCRAEVEYIDPHNKNTISFKHRKSKISKLQRELESIL